MPDMPYKGLMPYSEEDAPFFFGRELEREIITANLLASRLTLLYGACGVGKSSVLRAGVSHHLRQFAQQNLVERGTPESVVVVFSSWRDDPLAGLADRVHDSSAQALNNPTLEPMPPSRALAQTLQAWTERVDGDLLIILDQFEQYFLYHPWEDSKGTFAVEFPRAVNSPDLRCNFLISIREDSLAKLDRFKGRIPNLFDNYLRIEHLDREAARAAIEKPIKQYNDLRATDEPEISIEPKLVEAVLEQVETGQVVLGEAGRGVVRTDNNSISVEVRIEAPYLQLVMTRMWGEEIDVGSHVLRRETLKRLGGAEHIVRTHLDTALDALLPRKQDIAARVFHHLVTPSGTKIAHKAPDLAEYAKLSQAQLFPVLQELSSAKTRILRPVAGERYEIFHDVLAPAILDWRARFILAQERAKAKEKLAREKQATRLRWGVGGLVGILILVVLFISYAWWRAIEARIELVSSRLKDLDPTYEVPSEIALALTLSDMDFIVSKFQAKPTDSMGEEEEEEEALILLSLGELVEATYRLRLLKNSIEFVPGSLSPGRFQRISSHEHYRDGGDMGAYFQAMGTLGIQRATFFPTGFGPDNFGYLGNMEALLNLQESYAKKIIAFCTVDEGDADAPAIFKDCLEKGGCGLKLIGGHPDFYEPENPLDSPTMTQVFEIADRHHVPVVIHINMRKFPELQSQFEHILKSFPDVPFVAAHYCKDVPPFELCSHLLDTYSNLYTDTSMGGALDSYLADISTHRDNYRNFILRYQDRILWGADLIIDDSEAKTADFFRQRTSYDLYLLETGSEYDPAMVDTFQDIPRGTFALEDVQLFGLDLPEETLRKIYEDTPRRVLSLSE
jgi:predicted TIM-barrel fold metal-dependent hydrolase